MSDKKRARQRISKLKKTINHYRYLYHVLDKEEISQQALDSLKKELFDLEQEYPDLITADSPSQRVEGKPLAQFKKIKHFKPMFSFNDAFFEQDIEDWLVRIKKLLTLQEIKNLDFFAELKIDGLSASLIYQKGIFVKGATRGDGKIGEDITHNLKTIEAIPLKLEKEQDREIRGEIFIAKKDFEKLNKQREKNNQPIFANPRNTAAGAVRQLDPKIAQQRKLSFLAWQVIGAKTQQAEHQELTDLGFKPVDSRYCPNLSAVFDYYQEVLKKRDRFAFQIDGLVVSINDNRVFEKLGVVGKAPRGAIAYKFPLKQAETIVLDIKLQVGRTGAVTPVAILKPVAIGGATISRATLHNEDEIKRLGLRINDTVIIGRAGDVIPQVIKVLKKMRTGREKEFKMPRTCPVCGSDLVKKEKEAIWRCPNSACRLRQRRQFYHFVSKSAFNIDGLGPKIADQLLEQGVVNDPADLFDLKIGDLVSLERFADKSAQNLIQTINKSRKVSLARFIFSLGIRGVGEETAVDLAAHFGSIEKFSKATVSELEAIKDIGPGTANSIEWFFADKKNQQFINHLLNSIKVEEGRPKQKKFRSALGSFVFTGSLESMDRDQAKEKVRALGGDISSSVSRQTDFLVVGKEPGSKLARAQKLGVKIISEPEFLKIINQLNSRA